MTTKAEIQRWFEAGDKGYMLVICDTYDHGDYPVYKETAEEAVKLKNNPGSMQRVMEIYDLGADFQTQVNQDRCFAL